MGAPKGVSWASGLAAGVVAAGVVLLAVETAGACGLTCGAGAGGAAACGLVMAATVAGSLAAPWLGAVVVLGTTGATGVGTGTGAPATFGAEVAADGTKNGLFVKGQTTLDPALMPRTSTSLGGFVNGVRT